MARPASSVIVAADSWPPDFMAPDHDRPTLAIDGRRVAGASSDGLAARGARMAPPTGGGDGPDRLDPPRLSGLSTTVPTSHPADCRLLVRRGWPGVSGRYGPSAAAASKVGRSSSEGAWTPMRPGAGHLRASGSNRGSVLVVVAIGLGSEIHNGIHIVGLHSGRVVEDELGRGPRLWASSSRSSRLVVISRACSSTHISVTRQPVQLGDAAVVFRLCKVGALLGLGCASRLIDVLRQLSLAGLEGLDAGAEFVHVGIRTGKRRATRWNRASSSGAGRDEAAESARGAASAPRHRPSAWRSSADEPRGAVSRFTRIGAAGKQPSNRSRLASSPTKLRHHSRVEREQPFLASFLVAHAAPPGAPVFSASKRRVEAKRLVMSKPVTAHQSEQVEQVSRASVDRGQFLARRDDSMRISASL